MTTACRINRAANAAPLHSESVGNMSVNGTSASTAVTTDAVIVSLCVNSVSIACVAAVSDI